MTVYSLDELLFLFGVTECVDPRGGQAGLNTVLPGQEACPISRDQHRACVATLGPCPSGGRKDEKTVAEAGDREEDKLTFWES